MGFDIRLQRGYGFVAISCFALLYTPVVLLVIFSFNTLPSVSEWGGFSWQWYVKAWQNQLVKEAVMRSLIIASSAMIIATSVAVMAAVVTTRNAAFRGESLVQALINQPLMVPEIVTAVALLIFFAMIKIATGYSGLAYLIIAHSAFCVPFAYLPIRARLSSMDIALEQAATDLYATPWQVFRRITLPQLWPGILAGSMLAFIISLDDVIITEFVKSAGQDTLPTYMLGQLRRAVEPDVNAIATVLVAISLLIVPVYFILSKGLSSKQ